MIRRLLADADLNLAIVSGVRLPARHSTASPTRSSMRACAVVLRRHQRAKSQLAVAVLGVLGLSSKLRGQKDPGIR